MTFLRNLTLSFILTLCAFLNAKLIRAQISPKLPTTTVLTPEAASLTSYSEIPVNYYSGIPSISIPVYSLKSNDNAMNISISYHSGGIKVDEEASVIGLGWTINIGGMITEMKGTSPESGDPGPCNTTLSNSANSFFYSFEGYSGTFYVNNQTGYGITIKQEDISIQQLSPAGTGFKIITPNGYTYMFTEREINVGISSSTSAWKLTSIMSPNNNLISIEYERATDYDFQGLPNTAGEKMTSQRVTLTWCEINGIPGMPRIGDNICYPGASGFDIGPSGIAEVPKIKTSYIKKIIFNTGYIDLNYENRDDLNYPGSVIPKRLKEIVVYSNVNNVAIQRSKYSFLFDYTDYNNQNTKASKRLRLRELRQYSADNSSFLAWLFNYNTIVLPLKTSKDKDHWGFYNGPVNNQEIFPVSGANREPNENYVTAGMLQSITYPTGGQSLFEFESNDYSNRGSTGFKKGGGVRIKRITTTDGTNSMKKRFEYTQTSGSSTVSSGKLIYALNYSVPRGILRITRQCSGTRRVYSPFYDTYYDIPLLMTYEYGITYTSNYEQPKQPLYIGQGSPVAYSKVAVYEEGSVSNGRTIYQFINDEAPAEANPLYQGFYVPIARNDNGELLKKTDELFNPQLNAYLPIKTEENEYERVNTKYISIYRQRNIVTSDSWQPLNTPCQNTSLYIYNWGIRSDWTRLKRSTRTEYSSLNGTTPITTNIFYTYKSTNDPKNFLVSKIEYTDSKQQSISDEYKYPEDFSSSNPVYQDLVSRNIYSPIIEGYKKINGVQVSGQKNTYINTWYPVLGLQKNEQSVRNGSLFQNFNVNAYDNKGNITSMTNRDGITTSLMWSTNGEYPIARIINANDFNMGYTSFEPDENYNTSFSIVPTSATVESPLALMGKYYYNLSSNNLTYGSDLAGTKIISYWSRNGQYNVGGTISVKQGRTVNGWTYFEHRSNSNFFSITGNGAIDEVRIYPELAQMITYNHEPGIGLISQCDANNLITYYEYDGFGRLKLLRDQDGNILKTMEYHYKQ